MLRRSVREGMATEEGPEETKVGDQGMVTIPADLRRRLDIEPGDKLRWTTNEEGDLSVEIELIKTELDMPHSTAYKYLRRLEEMDILTRNEDVSPMTVTADPIHLQLNWIPNTVSSVPHPS